MALLVLNCLWVAILDVCCDMLKALIQAFWLVGTGQVYPFLLQSDACIQIRRMVDRGDGDVTNVVVRHIEVGGDGYVFFV